jgi:hypothetical protein
LSQLPRSFQRARRRGRPALLSEKERKFVLDKTIAGFPARIEISAKDDDFRVSPEFPAKTLTSKAIRHKMFFLNISKQCSSYLPVSTLSRELHFQRRTIKYEETSSDSSIGIRLFYGVKLRANL